MIPCHSIPCHSLPSIQPSIHETINPSATLHFQPGLSKRGGLYITPLVSALTRCLRVGAGGHPYDVLGIFVHSGLGQEVFDCLFSFLDQLIGPAGGGAGKSQPKLVRQLSA